MSLLSAASSSQLSPTTNSVILKLLVLAVLVFGATFFMNKNKNSKLNSQITYLIAGGVTALWGLLNIINTISGLSNGAGFTFMTFLSFVNGVTLIGIGGLLVVMRNPMLLTLAFALLALLSLIFFISDIVNLVRMAEFVSVGASTYFRVILADLAVLLICGIAIAKFLNLMPTIANFHWIPETMYTLSILFTTGLRHDFLSIFTIMVVVISLMMLGHAIYRFNND
jgi:hypothetical protein